MVNLPSSPPYINWRGVSHNGIYSTGGTALSVTVVRQHYVLYRTIYDAVANKNDAVTNKNDVCPALVITIKMLKASLPVA